MKRFRMRRKAAGMKAACKKAACRKEDVEEKKRKILEVWDKRVRCGYVWGWRRRRRDNCRMEKHSQPS